MLAEEYVLVDNEHNRALEYTISFLSLISDHKHSRKPWTLVAMAIMHYIKQILFFSLLGIIPLGLFFKIQEIKGGPELAALGLLGVFIFFLYKLYKELVNKKISLKIICFKALIILMTITIFSKYFYHQFWDIPTLIVVPLFIFLAIFLLVKKGHYDIKTLTTSILFLILTIPLFIDFKLLKEPGKYIPTYWNPKYNVTNHSIVKEPSNIKFSQTRELLNKAFRLDKSGDYNSATHIYEDARKLEPTNTTILLYMSNSYAQMNNLEKAISLLDTAISIDNTFPAFFNNRGLYYYKMNQNEKAIENYDHAIELDPSHPVFYANLALVYYYENEFDKACKAIKKLRDLKFDYSDQKELLQIEHMYCE